MKNELKTSKSLKAHIGFRIKDSDYQEVCKRAEAEELNVSDWVRKVLLEHLYASKEADYASLLLKLLHEDMQFLRNINAEIFPRIVSNEPMTAKDCVALIQELSRGRVSNSNEAIERAKGRKIAL